MQMVYVQIAAIANIPNCIGLLPNLCRHCRQSFDTKHHAFAQFGRGIAGLFVYAPAVHCKSKLNASEEIQRKLRPALNTFGCVW